jgi:hypothetical protein
MSQAQAQLTEYLDEFNNIKDVSLRRDKAFLIMGFLAAQFLHNDIPEEAYRTTRNKVINDAKISTDDLNAIFRPVN